MLLSESQIISAVFPRNIKARLHAISACQTAVGDDKAALGLGGVALKAGAKSAIATYGTLMNRHHPD
ncbi:MAG: CHAT domain-containing protein [Gammaproteobacteria bacterium]|nr:CHAT domain-containing protein [Gammaproteobacteria bacterium]